MPLATWITYPTSWTARLWKNLWIRRFAKNAVLAALTTLTPVIQDPSDYNLVTWHGLWHVLSLIGGAILTRELAFVIIPLLMKYYTVAIKWAQTPEPDDSLEPPVPPVPPAT